MGQYVNVGKAEFESVRKDEYVDKSMLIAYVNSVIGTQRKFLCVTRARRFGKSLAAKMLSAYYDESVDAHGLFQDLNIAKDPSYEEHRNKYPVIYFDMSLFVTRPSISKSEVVKTLIAELMDELAKTYPDVDFQGKRDLSDWLLAIATTKQKRFVMIIDEWDAICRDTGSAEVMEEYVELLRNLFKSNLADRIFAAVYMTGILPIKQYSTQSALNNFEEFSMVHPGPLAGYFGFTTHEVRVLAKRYKMDEQLLREWYDGYQIGETKGIYNPYAVMRALHRKCVESYWTSTAAYEGLTRYITMNFDGLRDAVVELLLGKSVSVDVGDFSNDMYEVNSRNAVITLLIHLGYLSYDSASGSARIPNVEVRAEFERAIRDSNWTHLAQVIRNSDKLLNDTLAGNADAVGAAVESVHQNWTSILQYHNEEALAYVVSLAYIAACKDYITVREFPSGKGFADIVFIPRRNVNKPAIVIELKYNHSAESGLDQIKRKQYADSLRDYVGDVVLVGISYDEKTKEHSCVIERMGRENSQSSKKNSQSKKKFTKYGQKIHKVILLLEALEKPLSASQMREICEKKDVSYFNRMTIQPMVKDGVIEPLDKESIQSPHQKYYRTSKGLELLTKLKSE